MLDEVEERRRGPVQVVEHADDRTILRLLFDQLAKAPGDLLCGGRQLGLSEQRPERRGSIAFWKRPELLHDLDHGPIRDLFSVRQAPPSHDASIDRSEEFRREPGLPYACRPEHGEELACAVVNRLGERVSKAPELGLATDHRCREASRKLSVRREQPECGN